MSYTPVSPECLEPDSRWPVGKSSAFFTLFVTLALGIFDFIDRQVLAALFPYIKAEYSLSDTQLGMLVSIVNIAIAVLVIPSAYLIDRWSRKKMMALMGIVWSLATGACAFAGTFSHLLIARFFIGAGEAGYNPAGQSLLAASFPRRLRGTALSAFQCSMGIGAPLGLILGAYIAETWGWRHAFGIVAIPGLLVSFLAFFIKDFKNTAPDPCEPDALVPPEPYWKTVSSLLSKPTLFFVFIAQAMLVLEAVTLMNWLPSYFNSEASMPMTEASSLSALYLVVYSAALFAGGPFVDFMRRYGMKATSYLQGLACLLAFGMLWVAFALATPGSLVQLLLLFAQNLFAQTVVTVGISITADLSQPQQRGTAVGLLVTFQNIFGMAIGPFITGVLSDHFSLGNAMIFMSTFYAVSGLLYFIIAQCYNRDMAKMTTVEASF